MGRTKKKFFARTNVEGFVFLNVIVFRTELQLSSVHGKG